MTTNLLHITSHSARRMRQGSSDHNMKSSAKEKVPVSYICYMNRTSRRSLEQVILRRRSFTYEKDVKDPQTLGVTREFKHAKDAKDPQRDERSAKVLVVSEGESDVVGQDCDNVDDAHGARHVVAAARCRVQAQQVLGREDGNTGRVQTEQFDAEPFSTGDLETAVLVLPTRHCLHDVGRYRY